MKSLASFVLFALTTLMASSGCQTGVTNTQINPKDYVFDFKAIEPSLKGPGGKKDIELCVKIETKNKKKFI